MYGTIARLQLKPGGEGKLLELFREFEAAEVPGAVSVSLYRRDADPKMSLYRMDAESNEYYLTVVFESKEAYFANADSPEQEARYQKLVELLEAEPEWYDGEIVYTSA